MKTVRISLNQIDKVKSFVNDLAKFDVDFDLVSGRYVIDAKSIMGIFSLDLSKPIDLNIHSENQIDEILTTLAPYIVQQPLERSRWFCLKRKKPLLSNALCSGSFLDLEERLQRLLWIIVVPPNPLFYMTSTG